MAAHDGEHAVRLVARGHRRQADADGGADGGGVRAELGVAQEVVVPAVALQVPDAVDLDDEPPPSVVLRGSAVRGA
ncbi:hypothetical protein [Isoptericola variabilis]